MQLTKRLKKLSLLAYALPALPLSMMGLIYFVFLPKFYISSFPGIITSVGVIILISRLVDAVLDPLIGTWSDCKTVGDRRRPFLFYATLPLICSFALLVLPQIFNPGVSETYYLLMSSLLFFLFWSIYSVPYEALGAELSFDYHERNLLFSVRDGMIVAGTILAALLHAIFVKYCDSEQQAFQYLAVTISALLIFATLLLASQVREVVGSKQVLPARRSFSEILKNRAFLFLLLAFLIGGFGTTLPATLLLFFVQYVLESDQGGLVLIVYLLVSLAGFPIWVWLGQKLNKKSTWILAILINSGSFLGVIFLGSGDLTIFVILTIISGLGYAGTQMIPSSLQADVIDYDEELNGIRREGEFVGLWSIARKFSAALGASIAFPILELAGFVANEPITDLARSTLSALYAGVPALCALGSIFFILLYPLSEQDQQGISAKSAARWLTKKGEDVR